MKKVQPIRLIAVVVIASAAWGIYAWRFAGDDSNNGSARSADDSDESSLHTKRSTSDGSSGQSEGADLGASSDPEQSPSAHANRPVGMGRRSRRSADVGGSPGPGPGMDADQEAKVALDEARRHLAEGNSVSARSSLTRAVEAGLPPADEQFAYDELTRLANVLVFSRATNMGDPLVAVHSLQAGDSLYTVGQTYKISEKLIARLNQITDPNRVIVGQRLKVLSGPLNARVIKSLHRMDVYLGDVIIRSYRVGLGAKDSTPVGNWSVQDKLPDPSWTDPSTGHHYPSDDPGNPIGEYWISLLGVSSEAIGKSGFGIHGTIEPDTIGENASMGCVRLLPDDIAELFDLCVVGYSTITIEP